MPDADVTPFPRRFEAEIALAEQALDLITDRAEEARPPGDAPQGSDVAALLDAIGELLRLATLEADGKRISRRETENAVARLGSAVDLFHGWPAAPRLRALAPVVEALVELELDWIATELAGLATSDLPESAQGDDVVDATERMSLATLRIMMRDETWDPSFEDLLQVAHRRALRRGDDDALQKTLKAGVAFNALRGRQSLLEEQRRLMAEAEPLPRDLATALDEYASESDCEDLVRWSLHLVLADAVAAGVIPPWARPRHVVAAAQLAIVRAEDPELDIDLGNAARWARMKASTLRALRDSIADVLVWQPEDDDADPDFRAEQRWRILSSDLSVWPARWTPPQKHHEDLPPYSTEAALSRLEQLPEVAWMMIDPLEAVRFVSEAFRYGGEAPDEMDVDIARRAIRLWEAERVVDLDEVAEDEDEDDDDWEDDEDEHDLPTMVTSSGEPLVFCTSEYEFAKGDRAEIVRRLDAMPELSREQPGGPERWVWLDGQGPSGTVLASIRITGRRMTTTAMSVVRSARIGARLADDLGELILLVDVETRPGLP